MKHIADALLEAFDLPQFRQPTAEQPHCVHTPQDLYQGMDDMGAYAEGTGQNQPEAPAPGVEP